jgi:hypothetical protein
MSERVEIQAMMRELEEQNALLRSMKKARGAHKKMIEHNMEMIRVLKEELASKETSQT